MKFYKKIFEKEYLFFGESDYDTDTNYFSPFEKNDMNRGGIVYSQMIVPIIGDVFLQRLPFCIFVSKFKVRADLFVICSCFYPTTKNPTCATVQAGFFAISTIHCLTNR